MLRLSAPAPFAAMYIAPLLPEFMAKHPEVRIDMHVTSEVVDLVAGGFDLAIRLCPKNDPSMIIRRLGRVAHHRGGGAGSPGRSAFADAIPRTWRTFPSS